MGADSSRIKGPPSLQVQSSLALFWNLSPKDCMHMMQILESRESQLRAMHAYHEVDIPLGEWDLFAETDMKWKCSKESIERWKQIRPYIKGISTNDRGAIAICLSTEGKAAAHSPESRNTMLALIAEKKPTLNWKIMVEYGGHMYILEKFLRDGPSEMTGYRDPQTLEQWQNKKEPEPEPEPEPEIDGNAPLAGLLRTADGMRRTFTSIDSLLRDEESRADHAYEEEEDSDSDSDGFDNYKLKRCARWDAMIFDLEKINVLDVD